MADTAFERALSVMVERKMLGDDAMTFSKAAIDAGFDWRAKYERCERRRIAQAELCKRQLHERDRTIAEQNRAIAMLFAALAEQRDRLVVGDYRRQAITTVIETVLGARR